MEHDVFASNLNLMENAVRFCQMDPSECSPSDRKEAENFLVHLRSSIKFPIKFCEYVLETSKDDAVRYHAVALFKDAILKDWPRFDALEIEHGWQYLLNFCYNHASQIPVFLSNELLQVVAMIVKRGTFDGKCGETDKIYELVLNLISSKDITLLSLACQVLSNICTEYYTTWKSILALSWDFHLRAKRHFEQTDLRKIFELSLRVLHDLATGSWADSHGRAILTCRFLNLSVCILTWNFGSKYLPKGLTCCVEFSPAFSLHPPESWRDLFLNEEVSTFFFVLHSQVRSLDNDACTSSMQCLIQLASLCGVVFPNDGARDVYLGAFITNLLSVFSGGINECEAVNFADIILKLFTYHALGTFRRLDPNLALRFFDCVANATCSFCQQATRESLLECDDTIYQEAFSKLLEGWTVQLKAEERLEKNENGSKALTEYAKRIIDCYVNCHLSKYNNFNSDGASHEKEMNELVEDDKERFVEVLHNFGIFARHCASGTTNRLIEEFDYLFQQYSESMTALLRNSNCHFASQTHHLQEDLHWLLLMITNFLTVADVEVVFYVPMEIYTYSTKFASKTDVDPAVCEQYLVECIRSPWTMQQFQSTPNLDPVVKLIGKVFRWASIECDLMKNDKCTLLSPQVAETTSWSLRRILNAFCETDERYSTSPSACILKQIFQTRALLSSIMIDFVLERFFVVLTHWNNEINLNKETSSMLLTFLDTDNKLEELSKNSTVVKRISEVDMARLCPAARKDLLKCMVKVCSSVEKNALNCRQNLNELILYPLKSRYESMIDILTKHSIKSTPIGFTTSDLLDVLDCFSGLMEGIGSAGAKALFHYVMPVLNSSISLLHLYKNDQPIVDAVLQLFVDVTEKLTNYIGDQNDAEVFYQCILNMLRTYAVDNIVKYKTASITYDEEKISDLQLFLKIITNLLSREVFMVLGSGANSTTVGLAAGGSSPIGSPSSAINVAVVAINGLEIILPLMNDDFLKYPSVCCQLFRLITSLCQLYPFSVLGYSAEFRRNILLLIERGLSFDFGNDAVKSCLDILQVLSSSAHNLKNDLTADVRTELGHFIKIVFETSLKCSSQIDLLHDSTACLFALICLNEVLYRNFVQQLVLAHQGDSTQRILAQSFGKLLPHSVHMNGLKPQQYRKEKLSFRDRFETFLDDIQGLLCYF